MPRPNQLFLLADHIKLSLLERQRAQSLINPGGGAAAAAGAGEAHDAQISRSLAQFRADLADLEEDAGRLRADGDEG
jgi:syntaxin 8